MIVKVAMGTSRCTQLALATAGLCMLVAGQAQGYERQWRAGGDFGYALASLPEGTLSGFGGGLHLSYGLSDAFNLRIVSDVTAFDVPDPRSYTLIWNNAVGIEYVLDILEWVPYVGLTAGPVDVMAAAPLEALEDGPSHELRLGLALPFGLGYQVLRELTVGLDGSYRLLLFGSEQSSTIAELTLFGRVEYVWGY